MKYGVQEIDTAVKPAVLDTGSWDVPSAWRVIAALPVPYWASLQQALAQDRPLPSAMDFTPHAPSRARASGYTWFLAGLADGQQVFIELAEGGSERVLGKPAGTCASVPGRSSRCIRPMLPFSIASSALSTRIKGHEHWARPYHGWASARG